MAEPVPPRRARLGNRLRRLRRAQFRSADALAHALGHRDVGGDWWQTRVSKMENGRQIPDEDELAAWVGACSGTDDDLAYLRELRAAARMEYRTFDSAWHSPGGIAATQDELAAEDETAHDLAEYQPAMIPSLAQTPVYTRDLLSAPGGPVVLGAEHDEIEQTVNARGRRQQLIYDPRRRIRMVMGEAALRTWFSPDPTSMLGQLDRLATLAMMSNVEVGVLPFDRPCPVLPIGGFAMNDGIVVWVESLTGEQRLEDPDEVGAYVAAFEAALAAAITGEAAVELFRRIAREVTGRRTC